MPCSLAQEWQLAMSGPEWPDNMKPLRICAHELVEAEGRKFVYITPTCCRWVRLVVHANPNAPDDLGKNPSITNCLGFRKLTELRNEVAWARTGQSLFAGREQGDQPQQKARKKLPSMSTLTIQVPAFDARDSRDIIVKAPSHPNDRVAVLLDPDVLDHVILYLRSTEFGEPIRQHNVSGAKGVWANTQRGSWLARYFDKQQKTFRCKSTGSAESAAEFLQNSAPLTDESGQSDDDAEDIASDGAPRAPPSERGTNSDDE